MDVEKWLIAFNGSSTSSLELEFLYSNNEGEYEAMIIRLIFAL